MAITSVLDVGCATGFWLWAWQQTGVGDIFGIDGPYVEQDKLVISPQSYAATDLDQPFDLGRTYDIVQSLEVAEHLQPAASERFINCLSRHSARFVLFSAAPPGQGGEFHINERPYEFWRDLLEEQGFVATDFVRPLIKNDGAISYWYRYNIFLFVRRDIFPTLPDDVKRTLIAPHAKILDVSPPLFRARKAILKFVPTPLQDRIAGLKSTIFPTRRF